MANLMAPKVSLHQSQLAWGLWYAFEFIWRPGSTKNKQIFHILTRPFKDPGPFVDPISKSWPPFLEVTCCLLPINKIRKRDSINYSVGRSDWGEDKSSIEETSHPLHLCFLIYRRGSSNEQDDFCQFYFGFNVIITVSLCVTVSRSSWLGRPSPW